MHNSLSTFSRNKQEYTRNPQSHVPKRDGGLISTSVKNPRYPAIDIGRKRLGLSKPCFVKLGAKRRVWRYRVRFLAGSHSGAWRPTTELKDILQRVTGYTPSADLGGSIAMALWVSPGSGARCRRDDAPDPRHAENGIQRRTPRGARSRLPRDVPASAKRSATGAAITGPA